MAKPPSKLPLVAAAATGFALGSYHASYRPSLSPYMNILGWVFDHIEIMPRAVQAANIDESRAEVGVYRARFDRIGDLIRYLPQAGQLDGETSFIGRHGVPIRVDVYRPKGPIKDRSVVVYLHGGGLALGSVKFYQAYCSALAHEADAVVVAVEYRLAPDVKFPIPADDCVDAIRWVWSNSDAVIKAGGKPRTLGLAVVGDSAGGNLTAVSSILLKDEIPIALQGLIYPVTAAYGMPLWRENRLPHAHDSMVRYQNAAVLTRAAMVWFYDLYLDDPNLAFDWRVSPVLATPELLRGVAPAVLITANDDPLRDEGIEYGKRLENAGVRVEALNLNNNFHGFATIDMTSGYAGAIRALARALQKRFAEVQHKARL